MKHWTYLMAEGITTRENGRGQVNGVDRVAAGSPRTVQPLAGAIPCQLRVRRRGADRGSLLGVTYFCLVNGMGIMVMVLPAQPFLYQQMVTKNVFGHALRSLRLLDIG